MQSGEGSQQLSKRRKEKLTVKTSKRLMDKGGLLMRHDADENLRDDNKFGWRDPVVDRRRRRQNTVLTCDYVRTVQSIEQTDPTDAR